MLRPTLQDCFVMFTRRMLRPRLTNASGALASRFIVLRMERSFYGSEDLHLFSKLKEKIPSILLGHQVKKQK